MIVARMSVWPVDIEARKTRYVLFLPSSRLKLYTSPFRGSVLAWVADMGPFKRGWRVVWVARPIGSSVSGSMYW